MGGPKLVIFDNGWIRSLNEKLSVSCKFETGIEGGLPIDQLYKALKIMKSDDIAVSSDKGQAVFKCGFSEMHLKLFILSDDTDFNVKKEVNLDIKWQPAPKDLLEGLKLSLLSAEDTEIGKLTGVIIGNSFILSSDNYRLSLYEMGEKISMEDPIRVKTSAVKFIVKMKKSFELMGVSDEWFHLKSGDDLVVSLKQVQITNYPLEPILAVFDNELHTEVYELPANLGQYIDRAELLAGSGVGELSFSTQISLKSKDGKLVITGENGVGSLSSKIPWSGIMPKLTIDPRTLRELLKLTQSFKIGTGKKQQQFVEFQVPNFKFIIVAKTEQVQEQVTQKADTKQELATKLQHLRELRERRN